MEASLKTIKLLILLCLFIGFISACSSSPKSASIAKPAVNKPSPKSAESTDTLGEFILQSARAQMGKRYKYGGTSPKTGFDCSGLAWYSHKRNGINIPRQTSAQFDSGKAISRKSLQPGDLVFFTTYRSGASHVGIYTGNGKFIHSPKSNKHVEIQTLSNSYFKKRYLGARRYW